MEVDPDYTGFIVSATEDDPQVERSRIIQENARDAAVDKIRTIIDDQFNKEIELKEDELMAINQKLADARCVMDRLRACVVASFYAASFTKPVDGARGPDAGAAYHPAIQNVIRKAVTSVLSKKAPPCVPIIKKIKPIEDDQDIDQDQNDSSVNGSLDGHDDSNTIESASAPVKENQKKNKRGRKKANMEFRNDHNRIVGNNLGGRQRIKKTIIVGNVSKYISPEQREVSDKSTHKWMIYVRGNEEEPRIDHFVKKVWFFLHPSYRPNDLVEVCEAPFHLTRRGWGEFPIRVQIHFCDRRNRPVDIIHGLRLDRSYTGLQTLGAETVCEVELDRSSLQLTVDDMLDVADLPDLPVSNSPIHEEKVSAAVESGTPVKDENEEEKSMVTEEDDIKHVKAEDDSMKEEHIHEQQNVQSAVKSCGSSVSDTESISRKRKLSHDKETSLDSGKGCEIDKNEESCKTSLDDDVEEEQEESSTPQKKKRKRRRDSCRMSSASDDDFLSDTNESATLPKLKEDQAVTNAVESKSVDISVTLDTTSSSKSEETEAEKSSNIESADSAKDDSVISSNSKCSNSSGVSENFRKPIVVLPRSEVSGNGFFRVRSASAGDDLPMRSCASLIKSGHSVTPVLNVKVSSPLKEKMNLSIEKETLTTAMTVKENILDSKILTSPTNPAITKSNESKQSPNSKLSTIPLTVPLSSLFKASDVKTPQLLKFVQPLPKGTTFSINMDALPGSGIAKRNKRSFSADQSLVKNITLSPLNVKPGSNQPGLQYHIISPPSKQGPIVKKTKVTNLQSPVSLQTLQAALSTGSLSISTQSMQNKTQNQPDPSPKNVKQDLNLGKQKLVLATIVNPKGKQQLALINPSTLSLGTSKKILTIAGKAFSVSTVKQLPQSKQPIKLTKEVTLSQQQQNITPKVLAPIHVRIGDQVVINNNTSSIVDDILPHVIKRIPLIKENRNITEFPFCAKTESEFLEWNVGKQRASEWQRAVLVHKVLKYIQTKSEKLQKCELPTKRFIMNWCLRHGYSVFTDEYEEETDQMEVDSNNEENVLGNVPSTISIAEELIKSLESLKEDNAREDNSKDDEDVIFVDVVNVDKPVIEMSSIKLEPNADVNMEVCSDANTNAEFTRIQSLACLPEVSVVEEITRKIGLQLQKTDGFPICHVIFAKAVQQFARTLLRKSLSVALKRRDGKSLNRVAPGDIDVLDVATAILETSMFDFLTDVNTASANLT
ncbi:uncharacterized protein LOC120328989 [Styela clava]